MTNEFLSQVSTSADPSADRWVAPALAARARELAAQGAVLLENDGTLPLAPGTRVAVFGRTALDWLPVGYGSGGDVNPPYLTNLTDSLAEAGSITLDKELREFYATFSKEHPSDPGTEWGKWPTHYPEAELPEGLIERAASRNDVAIVVIGRAAGEDRDAELAPGSYYLTAEEETLLKAVNDAFERTVVILDVGNVMDLSWAESLKPSALLIAWAGGMEAGHAIADVLTGASEPGGRLTSTIVRDYQDSPTAKNFGHADVTVYEEDVFVGYRYFETFHPEAVQYSFGFGLGYGAWQHEVTGYETTQTQVTVGLSLTNTGTHPSSHVPQLYLDTRSTKLSQPARRLVAFERTPLVQPGESVSVTLSFDLADFASFDDSGATGHPFAWVLEAGEYVVFAGANARDAVEAVRITRSDDLVVRECEEAMSVPAEAGFERLLRGTVGSAGAAGAKGAEQVPTADRSLRDRILSRLPKEMERSSAEAPTFDQVRSGEASLEEFVAHLELEDLIALTYGDTTMDSPLGVRGNAGAIGGVTERLRELGVAAAITTDGPSGLRVSAFASLLPCGTALASTFNPDAVEELAALHAEEMLRKGSDILLSPGMNIQRDPLCGRNFEYFSEDPLLSGLMGAAVVTGVQSRGVSACPKHFAANNQEFNRIHNDSRVSQRALREIYLRGFEIMVKASNPHTIMTSYNKVNGVWSHYNYDLATTILRDEWGWDGLLMTDWWMRMAPDPDFPGIEDSGYRVRAQVDVLMPGSKAHGGTECDTGVADSLSAEDGLTLAEVQRSALNVLRFILRTNPQGHAKVAEFEPGRRNVL